MAKGARGAIHLIVCGCFVVAFSAAWWPALLCRAETDVERPRVVILDADEIEGRIVDFEDTLRELLGRLNLQLVRRGKPASDLNVVATVHIELVGEGALVLVEGREGSSLRVEREVRATSSPAVFRETLAHVVLGAVEGLAAEDDGKGEAKAEPPPVPESPAPAQSDSRGGWRMTFGARGGPMQVARDRATAAFGGGIGLRFDTVLAPSISLDAAGALPTRTGREGVDASLHLTSLRAVPRVRLFDSRRFALEAGVSAGLDVVKLSSRARDVGTVPLAATRRAQPMLGPCASALVHASSAIDVVLSGGVDVDLAPRRWVVERGPDERPLVELSRARPYAYLGLVWSVFAFQRGTEAAQ